MKIKYLVILIALFIVKVNAQKIKFKDQNLKKALIELGYDFNKNKEIEIKEIDTVTQLKVAKKKLKSIEDLKHFKSLKIVNVMTNEITDLSVFFGNSNIVELYVGENKLGDKLLIKDMPNLEGLYAFRNGITEIEFIGNFDNFKSLYFQGNPVVNLNLENLPNLKNLQLFECDNLKTIDMSKKTKLKQFFLLDMKAVNVVSKNEHVKTIFLEKTSDPKNTPSVDSIKIAPTIKVKKGMIITPN